MSGKGSGEPSHCCGAPVIDYDTVWGKTWPECSKCGEPQWIEIKELQIYENGKRVE